MENKQILHGSLAALSILLVWRVATFSYAAYHWLRLKKDAEKLGFMNNNQSLNGMMGRTNKSSKSTSKKRGGLPMFGGMIQHMANAADQISGTAMPMMRGQGMMGSQGMFARVFGNIASKMGADIIKILDKWQQQILYNFLLLFAQFGVLFLLMAQLARGFTQKIIFSLGALIFVIGLFGLVIIFSKGSFFLVP